MGDNRITFRSFLIGLLFAGVFAVLTVRGESPWWKLYTTTQIPVLPYFLLVLSVAALNPILRLLRFIRPFSVTEIMIVFIMGMVSAGISTMGLASHMVPIMTGLFNEAGNNKQNRWDLYIEPYVSDGYFLAEPGTQDAARKLRDADAAWRDAQKLYQAAQGVHLSRLDLQASRDKLEKARLIQDDKLRREEEQVWQRRYSLAQNSVQKTQEWWNKQSKGRDIQTVLNTYPEKIKQFQADADARKADLEAIEAKAFDNVETFLNGLPKDMRAAPGFVYTPGEGRASYLARIRRLFHGTSALHQLEEADRRLAEGIRDNRDVTSAVADPLRAAAAKLEAISRSAELADRKKKIDDEIEAAQDRLVTEQHALKGLHEQRYYANADQVEDLESKIGDTKANVAKIDQKIAGLQAERDLDLLPRIAIVERVGQTREALDDLRADIEQTGVSGYPRCREDLNILMENFRTFDASWERFLVGDIPWSVWARPLLHWGLLVLTLYVVFMTFNVLIFKQWAHNENVIYPLAELPTALAGAEETSAPAGAIPPVFKSGLFWAGLGVSAAILGWNQYVFGRVPGVGQIPLRWDWGGYVKGSLFSGLQAYNRFEVFFTLIGLTFLIPARISYSLWSFQLLYLVQLLVIVWLGYGVDESSFETDWSMVLNFRTAEGAGALIIFAAVILWRCRRYIFCAFAPKSVADLESGERKELRISSVLFFAGSIGFILLLNRGLGANLFYAIFYYLVLLVITIGLTRAVAEGGFLSFKCHLSPFHLVRSTVGMDTAWTSPSLMAPLFVVHSVLFFSYRAFIAPAMANALKIRDKLKMTRLRFHGIVTGGILCGLVVGLGTHIILSYTRGGNAMAQPHYRWVPSQTFDAIKTMAVTNPVDTQGGKWWLLIGAAAMMALLYFRQRVFWLPHPIGLIMLVNPMMTSYWFSIFLGWTCKSLVSKYGNKEVYRKFKYLFLGLIVGELIVKGFSGMPLDTQWLWEKP